MFPANLREKDFDRKERKETAAKNAEKNNTPATPGMPLLA
jgi:hypothetical protein